jgi:hypothetical protein
VKIIPRPAEVGREALIVVGGAILAAVVIGAFPALRDWIKRQWDGAPRL